MILVAGASLTIGSDGTVRQTEIITGVPECPALDEAAAQTVSQFAFCIKVENGPLPEEFAILVPMDFRLDSK